MNNKQKKTLYESIIKSVAKTVKHILNEDIHPNDIKSLNINWDAINKRHHWWHNIPLQNYTKYPANELKAWDISYDIVDKINKVINKIPESVIIRFDNEDEWSLCIDHETSYNRNTYSLYAHGGTAPWKIPFSKMNITEKRSIMERLKTKEFYVYNLYKNEYTLLETPLYSNKKGVKVGVLIK